MGATRGVVGHVAARRARKWDARPPRRVWTTSTSGGQMMRLSMLCAAAVVLVGAASADAQLLFGYEAGEPGHPYAGNPAPYVTSIVTTTPPVTQGTQALSTTINAGQFFGGPGSAAFTDAVRAAII